MINIKYILHTNFDYFDQSRSCTFPLSACFSIGLLISVWSESKPKLQSLRSSSLLLRSFTKASSLVRSLALLQTLSNEDSSSEDTSSVARSLKLLAFSHTLMLEMEGRTGRSPGRALVRRLAPSTGWISDVALKVGLRTILMLDISLVLMDTAFLLCFQVTM